MWFDSTANARPCATGNISRSTTEKERVLSRACGRLGGPTVALKLREATPNEHGLKAARPCDNGHDLKQKEPGSVATRTKRGDAPADFRRDE